MKVDSNTATSPALNGSHRNGAVTAPAPSASVSTLRSVQIEASPDDQRWLSQGAPAMRNRLDELASHSFVRRVAVLPDCHWKADMELPSSVAVDCGNHIVPDVTSVAMNDCMSLILTDWHKNQIGQQVLTALFENVNRRAAAARSRLTAYSPSESELLEILDQGAAAAVRKYGGSPDLLDAMERRGHVAVDDIDAKELRRLVPGWLLRHPGFRAEFGLNFGGNHFLEVQYVSDVVDPALARKWNMFPGQVVLMTHLGPGPFTGNLLHLYSRRQKVRPWRRAAYWGFKLPLHFRSGRESTFAERYRAYFTGERFAGHAVGSEIGHDLDCVIRLGSNYGFAYQVGCYQAVVDSLGTTARALNLPDHEARLLWSVSHNHFWRETVGHEQAYIGRHNSVRSYPGKPALLAGRNDVDTCLGVGLQGNDDLLNSYDHGVGSLLQRAEKAGALPTIDGTSTSYYFARGRQGGLQKIKACPLRDRRWINKTMDVLQAQQIIQSVCYLRPLGTMHN